MAKTMLDVVVAVADPEGGLKQYLQLISPYKALSVPYMVKMNCEYDFSPPSGSATVVGNDEAGQRPK